MRDRGIPVALHDNVTQVTTPTAQDVSGLRRLVAQWAKAWELAGCFDLGDIVGVDGQLRRTRTGELTIFAEELHFLCKSIEPDLYLN